MALLPAENLQRNIFKLSNKQFGIVSEDIVRLTLNRKKEYNLEKPLRASEGGESGYDSFKYDFNDETHGKVEIKSARARKKVLKCEDRLKALIEGVEEEIYSSIGYKKAKVKCLFQHIKPKYFNILIYALYTSDMISVYSISKKELLEDKEICYSRQGRDADEGQFCITEHKIDYHDRNYLIDLLDYSEVYEMIKNL